MPPSTLQVTKIQAGVPCHCWNGDRTMCAVSPNTHEIYIYNTNGSESFSSWTRAYTLTEHDMQVSAMDWSPVTNMIVSCSHDRNAFVWTYDAESDSWSPSLTVLRIDRAALDVKWSPDGAKFALASGSKVVPVCHYEEEGNWWVGKQIKKHKSTVTSVAWHPNCHLLATGGTDFKCRVFNAFIEEVDGDPANTNAGPYGTPVEFGEPYATYDGSNAWIHSVAWSPSGNTLAYVGHDSTVSFVTFDGTAELKQTIRMRHLPATCSMFLSETAFVAAGHDFNPLVFTSSGGTWSFMRTLEEKAGGSGSSSAASESKAEVKELTGAAAARARFAAMDKKGVGSGSSRGAKTSKKESIAPWTQHEMTITSICTRGSTEGGAVAAFSTSGMDGRVTLWNLSTLNIDMAALGL